MLQSKEGVNQEIGRNNTQEIRYLAESRNCGKYQDDNDCYFYTVIFPDQVWKEISKKMKWKKLFNKLESLEILSLVFVRLCWKILGKKWSWVYKKLSKWKNESVTNQTKNNDVMG